jgi:hypothetical protein
MKSYGGVEVQFPSAVTLDSIRKAVTVMPQSLYSWDRDSGIN